MEMHINNSRTIYAANTSKTVLFLVVAPVRVSFDRVASFCVGRVSSRARRVRSAYQPNTPACYGVDFITFVRENARENICVRHSLGSFG